MAGFMGSMGALGLTSTLGAFVGGMAKEGNEQIHAQQDADDERRKAQAQMQIAVWKKEMVERDKEQHVRDYLSSIGVTGKGVDRAVMAFRGGMTLKDIVSGLEYPNNTNGDKASANSIIGGTPNAGTADTTVLDQLGHSQNDALLAAPIVRAVEMGKYGYNGGYGDIDLSKYPDKPGYYGFPDWPGVGNTHASGGYGWEPETWKKYAATVSSDLGRPVNFRNPSDQDLVFDKAWMTNGKADWAPFWNQQAWGRAATAAQRAGIYMPKTQTAQNAPSTQMAQVPNVPGQPAQPCNAPPFPTQQMPSRSQLSGRATQPPAGPGAGQVGSGYDQPNTAAGKDLAAQRPGASPQAFAAGGQASSPTPCTGGQSGGQINPQQANQEAMMMQPVGQPPQQQQPQPPLQPSVQTQMMQDRQQPAQLSAGMQTRGLPPPGMGPGQGTATQGQMPQSGCAGAQMGMPPQQGTPQPQGPQSACGICFHYPNPKGSETQYQQQEIDMRKQELQRQQQMDQDRNRNEAMRNEIELRKLHQTESQKPASPEEALTIDTIKQTNAKYMTDPKTGLQARFNDLPDLQKSAFDTQSMMDMLNNGFKASATTGSLDELNRWTNATLGLDLYRDLGFKNVNDPSTITLMRKELANAVIDRLKTLHFGRITNFEAKTVYNGFASSDNTPSTNLKITLTMQTLLKEAQEGTTQEYQKALNVDGSGDPNSQWGPGNPTTKSIGAARVLRMQLQQKYDSDVAPWTQVKTAGDVQNVPVGQWFQVMGGKDPNNDMFIKGQDGKIYAAGEKVPQ